MWGAALLLPYVEVAAPLLGYACLLYTSCGQFVVTPPAEGLWSIATAWRDGAPAEWRHVRAVTLSLIHICTREQIPSRDPFFGSAPFRAPASLLRSAFGFRFREFADTFAKR